MRKIVCMLAAIIAISTLTGCPANKEEESSSVGSDPDSNVTELADLSSGSAVESNSAGNEAASAGDPAQSEDSAAPEIPAADDFIPTVDRSIIYRSGTWYFTSNDKDGNTKHYLYLTDSKELISFEPEDEVVDVSGCLVAYENGTLKNVKTDEIYAGSDTGYEYIRHYSIFWNNSISSETRKEYAFANDGTAMIAKIDPGFDSVTVNIGVINNDGTWRKEITSENGFDTHTDYDTSEWNYLGDGFVCCFFGGYYNSDADYWVEVYNISQSAKYIYSNETNAYFINGAPDYRFSKMISFDKKSREFFEYVSDYDTGIDVTTRTNVSYNVSGSCVAYAKQDIDSDDNIDSILAFNMEKGVEMLFDISAFEISYWKYIMCGVVDNALMFQIEGADGSEYTCMINQEGERLIEPKIMDYICTVGDKFLCTVDGTLTMFDSSGKETKLPGTLAKGLIRVGNYSGVIAVETDEGFKLVDLNDPENPFTPFDAV